MKFHENPFDGSRVVPCGRMDGRTDITKLIVAFRNFAKAPKNRTKSGTWNKDNNNNNNNNKPKRF